MNIRLILGGLKSYLPVRLDRYKGTQGSVDGAYCYAVWLRHRVLLAKHAPDFVPRTLVEIGPGDSIGLGLAALLSGVERYLGLDVLEHASVGNNLRVLDELADLFRQRAPAPDRSQYPMLLPELDEYAFPHALFDETTLRDRLTPEFIGRLRRAIEAADNADPMLQYHCPWSAAAIQPASIDLVLSHVALQDMDHLPSRDDLAANLAVMATWLRPGGIMSHQIDFSCPGGAEWNHHWAYGDLAWTLIRGKRPYYKNRVPLSEYVRLLDQQGMEVIATVPARRTGLTRAAVAPRFRHLPESDFETYGALIIARKRR